MFLEAKFNVFEAKFNVFGSEIQCFWCEIQCFCLKNLISLPKTLNFASKNINVASKNIEFRFQKHWIYAWGIIDEFQQLEKWEPNFNFWNRILIFGTEF